MHCPFPQAMEAELASHESVIASVCATGQDLNSSGHFASSRIRGLRSSLQEAWSSLLESANQRSQLLQDSLAMQQYYTRATEAESWMNDRRPLVGLEEYGKDEDGTQVGRLRLSLRFTHLKCSLRKTFPMHVYFSIHNTHLWYGRTYVA